MNSELLSEYVQSVLIKVGWSFDRKVSTKQYQIYFDQEGMSYSSAVIKILENFGGITVSPPTNPNSVYATGELRFDPILADRSDLVHFWEKKLESSFCSLGSIWGNVALLVLSEKDIYYGLSDAGVHYISDNLADALEVLIAATSNPPLIHKLEDYF
jgi:hypothetical protein